MPRGDSEPQRGTIHAYRTGTEPIVPWLVPDVRFADLAPGRLAALAGAMDVAPDEIVRRLALGGRALLALVQDEVIAGYGWISYDIVPLDHIGLQLSQHDHHAYIWDCATLPAFRGRGIFPGLLRTMLEQLRIEDVAQVWAAVARGNTASLRAFAKAGFRIVATSDLVAGSTDMQVTEHAHPEEAATLTGIGLSL